MFKYSLAFSDLLNCSILKIVKQLLTYLAALSWQLAVWLLKKKIIIIIFFYG